MRKKLFSLSCLCALLSFTSSSFAENADTVDLSHSIAKASSYVKTQKKLKKDPIQPNPNPYWAPLGALETKGSVFFQPSVGLGLLYFHQVRGNLCQEPNTFVAGLSESMPSIPYKRNLSYNKTLVKDILVGYRFFDWFKLGLSYQNQNGIFLYSQPLPYMDNVGGERGTAHMQLATYLSLNSVMAKAIFEIPHALIYRRVAFAPFGALAIGPSWQTWYLSRNQSNSSNDGYMNTNVPQFVANLSLMLDKGVRFQPAVVNPSFSGYLGFKFMLWGQARNLYQLQKQGPSKSAIFKPFNIKTIYSFIPYLGFQWNFPATRLDYIKHKKLYASEVDSFFIHTRYTVKPKNFITQFNFGPNFLYFKEIDGNLAIKPLEPDRFYGRQVPMSKKFKYNRVPLYEFLMGYRYSQILQFGLSLQTSNYNILQSPFSPASNIETTLKSYSSFKSYLNLYALMAKAYLYLPYAFRAGFVSMNFYSAVGFGPSWQCWYDVQVNSQGLDIDFLNSDGARNFSGKTKFVTNPSLMVDMGFDMKNAHPDALFHIYLGVRYNRWGQVRNIGKQSQQASSNNGLLRPVRVKTLYSWTPYMSFQWDFPLSEGEYLAKQYSNAWTPYFVSLKESDKPSQLFFQGNIGPNFLRFSGVKGNLGRRPIEGEINNTDAPLKGRLSKNNPLLFEFLVGHKFNYWFKAALSLQSQTAIYVSSKRVPTDFTGDPLFSFRAQFQSQVQLYSLMLKPYLESPKGVIFRNWIWTSYLGMGIGAGWQSWNNNTIYEYADEDNNVYPFTYLLRSKTSASVAWMIDLGFRTRHVSPKFNGSVLFGIKYNQWGQARNIGKLADQYPTYRAGLQSAFRVKTVYSFAPYMGFQWNF